MPAWELRDHSPSVGVATRLYCWRSAIGDLLDSGAPLSIEVTGVPPRGFIPGQSSDDFSRIKDEVAAVVETSHALDEKEEDILSTRRKVETDACVCTWY